MGFDILISLHNKSHYPATSRVMAKGGSWKSKVKISTKDMRTRTVGLHVTLTVEDD